MMPDIESIRLQIVKRLPVRVRWPANGTFLDFDFSRSEAPLKPVAPRDFNGATVIESEWTSLQIFGGYDYAEGGGANPFLGVHCETGAVFGLDAELYASAMFIFNSDVDRFIETFLALDRALRLGEVPGPIKERLREIDSGVFERSEWRSFADHLGF
jgi:hypothetical protein